jgi:hypothetical protein
VQAESILALLRQSVEARLPVALQLAVLTEVPALVVLKIRLLLLE